MLGILCTVVHYSSVDCNMDQGKVCLHLGLVAHQAGSYNIYLIKRRASSKRGRRGGLMVSALDSGLNDPGSSLGRSTSLYSWAGQFTLTLPLFTQVYKWVPANLLLWVTV